MAPSFCGCFGGPRAATSSPPSRPVKKSTPDNDNGVDNGIRGLDASSTHPNSTQLAVPDTVTKTPVAVRPTDVQVEKLNEQDSCSRFMSTLETPSTVASSARPQCPEPTLVRALLASSATNSAQQGSFAVSADSGQPATEDWLALAGATDGINSPKSLSGLSAATARSIIPSFSPGQLKAEVGDLVFIGQGATGLVYRGTVNCTASKQHHHLQPQYLSTQQTQTQAQPSLQGDAPSCGGSSAAASTPFSSTAASPGAPAVSVAVKFMICNTPQQLWQRAKEALLSKLVSHPNLVRTIAMDVTLVTPNTYREWGNKRRTSLDASVAATPAAIRVGGIGGAGTGTGTDSRVGVASPSTTLTTTTTTASIATATTNTINSAVTNATVLGAALSSVPTPMGSRYSLGAVAKSTPSPAAAAAVHNPGAGASCPAGGAFAPDMVCSPGVAYEQQALLADLQSPVQALEEAPTATTAAANPSAAVAPAAAIGQQPIAGPDYRATSTPSHSGAHVPHLHPAAMQPHALQLQQHPHHHLQHQRHPRQHQLVPHRQPVLLYSPQGRTLGHLLAGGLGLPAGMSRGEPPGVGVDKLATLASDLDPCALGRPTQPPSGLLRERQAPNEDHSQGQGQAHSQGQGLQQHQQQSMPPPSSGSRVDLGPGTSASGSGHGAAVEAACRPDGKPASSRPDSPRRKPHEGGAIMSRGEAVPAATHESDRGADRMATGGTIDSGLRGEESASASATDEPATAAAQRHGSELEGGGLGTTGISSEGPKWLGSSQEGPAAESWAGMSGTGLPHAGAIQPHGATAAAWAVTRAALPPLGLSRLASQGSGLSRHGRANTTTPPDVMRSASNSPVPSPHPHAWSTPPASANSPPPPRPTHPVGPRAGVLAPFAAAAAAGKAGGPQAVAMSPLLAPHNIVRHDASSREGPPSSCGVGGPLPAGPAHSAVWEACTARGGNSQGGNPRTEPVPFQDILYHLDALPGRFLAKVIMEYCDGGTLLQRINAGDYVAHPDKGPLAMLSAMRSLLWCLQEVAAGMAHLHSLNIIHGDLKPSNVLLTSEASSPLGYVCKVSDFGLATALEASEQTITHEDWGTVMYMAPESCAGRCRKASDVYSFGVLLWQMCTGQRPYAGMQAGQVLLGVKTGTLKLQWPTWANKSLVKVGQACMRFEPKERPGFKGIRSALAKISARLDQKMAAVEAAGLQGELQLLAAETAPVAQSAGAACGDAAEDEEGA